MAISNSASGFRPGVCTSTTRPTSPFNGQVIYETDSKQTLVWQGSAWVMLTDADTPPGLQLVATKTVTNGTSLQLDDCFSSEFTNYKFAINFTSSSVASQGINFRLGNGSTFADTNYGSFFHYLLSPLSPNNGNWAVDSYGGSGAFVNQIGGNVGLCSSSGDIFSPFESTKTMYNCWSNTSYNSGLEARGAIFGTGGHNTAASYASIRFFGPNNFTATCSIYGYRK